MSNLHNHPPRCCCIEGRRPEAVDYTCPACPEHGELAPRVHLVDTGSMFAAVTIKPTDLEHTPDLYSQIRADQQQPACSRPGSNRGDGRGCDDFVCPRHGAPSEDEDDDELERQDDDGPAPYHCGYCPNPRPCAWGTCTGAERARGEGGDSRHWSDGTEVDPAELDNQR